VVISIIALLIALLLPALGGAQELARQAYCANNQRQLGIAVTGYTEDFDNSFPQPFTDSHLESDKGAAAANDALWFNAVDEYLQTEERTNNSASGRNYTNYKQDPAWTEAPEAGDERRDNRTIKMNNYLGEIGSGWRFFTRFEIRFAAQTALFADGIGYDLYPASVASGFRSDFHIQNPAPLSNPSIFAGLRHAGGANVGFIDGHASHEVQETKIHTTGGGHSYEVWYNEDTAFQELKWDPDLQ